MTNEKRQEILNEVEQFEAFNFWRGIKNMLIISVIFGSILVVAARYLLL